MKNLKEIKILPLTDFDSLQLNVVEGISLNLGVINESLINEFLSKANSLSRVIKTSNIGNKHFVMTNIKGTMEKNKIFPFPEPNPICIYYKSANKHLEKSYSLKNKFYSHQQHFNYNSHFENFVEYFQETSEGVILLNNTIEGFFNQLLPDNMELKIEGIKRNKEYIEFLDIKTKLRKVMPLIMGIDFHQTNSEDYNNICLIIDLRNDLVHLKKVIKEDMTNYQSLFKRLLDFKHIDCSNSVFTFVNTITPDYFIEVT